MNAFILASQSPRRKTLLEWAEIPFEIIVSETDESYPSTISIEKVPIHIAEQKALAVKHTIQLKFPEHDEKCIIAADTIVVLNDTIIGKPTGIDQAIHTLQSLSGKTHKVITGVVLLHKGQMHSFSETTIVEFHPLTIEQIEFYVHTYQPFDKAGAYAIQEWIGVVGIKGIQGDFYNVMGLPVSRLLQKIKQLPI